MRAGDSDSDARIYYQWHWRQSTSRSSHLQRLHDALCNVHVVYVQHFHPNARRSIGLRATGRFLSDFLHKNLPVDARRGRMNGANQLSGVRRAHVTELCPNPNGRHKKQCTVPRMYVRAHASLIGRGVDHVWIRTGHARLCCQQCCAFGAHKAAGLSSNPTDILQRITFSYCTVCVYCNLVDGSTVANVNSCNKIVANGMQHMRKFIGRFVLRRGRVCHGTSISDRWATWRHWQSVCYNPFVRSFWHDTDKATTCRTSYKLCNVHSACCDAPSGHPTTHLDLPRYCGFGLWQNGANHRPVSMCTMSAVCVCVCVLLAPHLQGQWPSGRPSTIIEAKTTKNKNNKMNVDMVLKK